MDLLIQIRPFLGTVLCGAGLFLALWRYPRNEGLVRLGILTAFVGLSYNLNLDWDGKFLCPAVFMAAGVVISLLERPLDRVFCLMGGFMAFLGLLSALLYQPF
ncbi:MAG: hypothetical protein ISS36_01260 [Candidatus Aenigmarchaeota archaeon]|nr:hypothetical protein [Candidatus Aenigmarchaeota archaeon]